MAVADHEAGGRARRRLVLVLARHDAAGAAPPGVDPEAFARACLADTYEVAADLVDAGAGVVGPPELAALLYPGAVRLDEVGLPGLLEACTALADEVVLLPADAPDLPGLVVAKQLKVLHRTDVAVAPERGGPGCVALGFRLPAAAWLPLDVLDLDSDPTAVLRSAAPARDRVGVTPDWHRLRGAAGVHRLDPALEGWEETRALLSSPRG